MNNNDHAIKIAGYFGIDVNRPRDNYVYASINAFTIAKVFEAFELGEPNLPKFVADTGFPEGITVAYSTTGKLHLYIWGKRILKYFRILCKLKDNGMHHKGRIALNQDGTSNC